MADRMDDDPCAWSFQLLSTPKKKNKLEKLNGKRTEQSVNSFHRPSFSSDHSSFFPWHVNSQDTEDNHAQKQKSESWGKDTGNDLCASSFQPLGSPKKKKKKKKKNKNKLEKLNVETNELSVNPFFHPSFSSDSSSVFSEYVGSQDTKDYQTEPRKSKRRKKDTRETPDSKLESSWVVPESNLDDEVGRVAVKKKKKRKHRFSEQDKDNGFYIPETPEETSSLLEASQLEVEDGICAITPKKKKKLAKVLSGEQVEASEASVDGTDFASNSENTQDYLFVSPSQIPSKTQDAGFLRTKTRQKLSVPGPSTRLSSHSIQNKPCKHRKHPSVSCPIGNSDATEDGRSAEDTEAAGGKHNKSEEYHILQKSTSSVHTDEEGSSSPKCPNSELDTLDNEFLESSSFQMQDLESITRQLEEFIPHVRTLSESLIKQLAFRDLVRFKNFKKQGISVRFGKFSKEENNLLRKNVKAFLEESGIDSAEKLLFTDRFPEEQADLKKLKRDHLFGLKIAQGIPRPWRLVYYRARKMFDPQNYNGKYSKKEKKKLRKYQTLYGNNWKKMSELMGRSSHSLQLKYYDVNSKFNSGAWSREETKKLLDTLKEILRAKIEGLDSTQKPKNMDQAMLLREKLYKDIPWFRVEAKVRTRGWKQCKRKWMSIVTKKMSRGKTRNRGLENLRFKIDVIERLYELDVEDTDDIDWEDLSRIIGNVPPDYVRNRFYKIKSMYVPYWTTKTFPETIDYLYKEILPHLRSKVEGKETKEVATEDESWKKAFKFNEIFQDDDDLIDEEEEEEEEEVEEE